MRPRVSKSPLTNYTYVYEQSRKKCEVKTIVPSSDYITLVRASARTTRILKHENARHEHRVPPHYLRIDAYSAGRGGVHLPRWLRAPN